MIVVCSDILKSVENQIRHCVYVGVGAGKAKAKELANRVNNALQQVERLEWEAHFAKAETEKMKAVILHLMNRAVIDYRFGQMLCPYAPEWDLLVVLSAAILNRDEEDHRVKMKDLWEDCPRPVGEAPRPTALSWLQSAEARP